MAHWRVRVRLTNDDLVHEAPAIVGRQTPSAVAYAATASLVVGRERDRSRPGADLSGCVANGAAEQPPVHPGAGTRVGRLR